MSGPSELEQKAAVLGAPVGAVAGREISPMLCAQADRPAETIFGEAGWIYELKLDGVRILVDRDGDRVSLTYRKSRDATAHYPEVVQAVRELGERRVVLDGEIVAFDERGHPDFQRLARRIHQDRPRSVAAVMTEVPVVLLVFDVLAVGDRDLRGVPLAARKALLRDVVPDRGTLRVLDHLETGGDALFEMCRSEGLEGIVAKRSDSTYKPGPYRTGQWVKIKCERDAEFVVVGWTVGERDRSRLGALDLAAYEDDALVIRGKVGSGLDDRTIDRLLPRLEVLEVEKVAARGQLDRAPRGRRYVRPEIVVSVRYLGWSDEGRLRFPVFRGVRDDVSPEECCAGPHGGARDVVTGAPGVVPARPAAPDGPRKVNVSNRQRMVWSADGITKGDLCDYYERIAPTLLPYLADRPVVLVRYPYGISGKSFHQWNIPRWTPSWVRYAPIRSERSEVNVFLVDDVDTLLFIINLGCIPLHVTGSRVDSQEACDFFTFDFDVGGASLADAVRLALALRELLDSIGLPSFPKTSGQSGLHVLVGLGGDASFATARALGELLGRLLCERYPDLATREMAIDKRGKRVLVDVGQTHPLRTIVAPYSVRAHPGATVSAPLAWEEVTLDLDPRRFALRTMLERIATLGDPMRGLLAARADVGAAVARLGALVGR